MTNLILNKSAAQITDEIGEEDGILILDPTSFPKKRVTNRSVFRENGADGSARMKNVKWQHSSRMQAALNLHCWIDDSSVFFRVFRG